MFFTFLNVHLHHFPKRKVIKKSQNSSHCCVLCSVERRQKSLYFCVSWVRTGDSCGAWSADKKACWLVEQRISCSMSHLPLKSLRLSDFLSSHSWLWNLSGFFLFSHSWCWNLSDFSLFSLRLFCFLTADVEISQIFLFSHNWPEHQIFARAWSAD